MANSIDLKVNLDIAESANSIGQLVKEIKKVSIACEGVIHILSKGKFGTPFMEATKQAEQLDKILKKLGSEGAVVIGQGAKQIEHISNVSIIAQKAVEGNVRKTIRSHCYLSLLIIHKKNMKTKISNILTIISILFFAIEIANMNKMRIPARISISYPKYNVERTIPRTIIVNNIVKRGFKKINFNCKIICVIIYSVIKFVITRLSYSSIIKNYHFCK
jgi:hypothetical protein